MRKAIASFTIGTLLASFLAVPAAFAGSTPDWAMEGANAYLKAETRDQGFVLANKCEVATMIANALNLPMGDAEMQRGAEFQDLQGGMAWCQAAAGAVANTGIATGNGNMFGAAGSVSRAVVATMLVRAFQLDAAYQPASLSSERQAEFAGLEWAQEPMALGVAAGIIQGDAAGRLLPTEGGSKWAVATMLHRAAGLDAESTPEATPEATEETTEETTEEATPEVAATGGALSVSLSDNYVSKTIYAEGAGNSDIHGVELARFELSASTDDVRVSTLAVSTKGTNDVISKVALFDSNGVRISRARSFNTDREASLSFLNGGLTISGGTSIEVVLVGDIAADSVSASIGVLVESPEMVSSNASSVTIADASTPMVDVKKADAATLTFSNGSSSPSVSVGAKNVEIDEFDIDASGEDVELTALTLRSAFTGSEFDVESDGANYVLEIEGTEVASTPLANDSYVSFRLDTPYLIEDGDTVTATVKADILDGAGTDIAFYIDESLDVQANDLSINNGATVVITDMDANDDGGLTFTEIDAGEVTVLFTDASFDEFGSDKENLILGTAKVVSQSGDNLIIRNLNPVFTRTSGAQNVDDLFENFEVVTSSGVYDLDDADCAAAANCTLDVADIDLTVPAMGSITLTFRADTKTFAEGFRADNTFELSYANLGNGAATDGIFIEELTDDQAVTDITPSSYTHEAIDSELPTGTVVAKVQSATQTVVRGSSNLVAMIAQLEAGNASHLSLENLSLMGREGDADGNDLSSTQISQVRMYHTAVLEENLIDSAPGSSFSSGEVQLEFDNLILDAGQKLDLYFVVDIVDDNALVANQYDWEIDDINARDSENDDVTFTSGGAALQNDSTYGNGGAQVQSTRTLVVADTGVLLVQKDTTDTLTNKDANLILGAKSQMVTSVELTAQNEDITIKDLYVIQEDAGVDLEDHASAVYLYANGDLETPFATESVTSDTVFFEDVNLIVEQGTENIYFALELSPAGKDLAGDELAVGTVASFSVGVADAQGQRTIDAANITHDVEANNGFAAGDDHTTASQGFQISKAAPVAVKIKSASADGSIQANQYLVSETTMGVLEITAGTNPGNTTDAGQDVELTLDQIILNLDHFADANGTAITSITLERLDGSDGEVTNNAIAGNAAADATGTATFIAAQFANDFIITPGQTVEFVIKANVAKGSESGDFLKVYFDDVNDGNALQFSTTEANDESFVSPFLRINSITGPSIDEQV